MTLTRLTLAALAVLMLPMTAMADIWSVEEAQAAVAEGRAILIDIRSEGEWKDTGLAKGAWPISMHTPDFGAELQKLIDNRGDKVVAMICATGGRTGHVMRVLDANGIDGFVDVSEGMMGSPYGKGWIAKGLPVVSLDEAEAAMAAGQ